MPEDTLHALLTKWKSGQLDIDRLELELRTVFGSPPPVPDVRVDLDRKFRCGYPEVVYSSGKSSEAILEVFRSQQAAGQNSFATRISVEQVASVQKEFPTSHFNAVARTLTQWNSQAEPHGRVVVVSAGTSDRPVAEEAIETVRWMGCETELILDIGVAGPQRLLAQRDRLAKAAAIVVVAGMEGALPSAVAGWVSVPVIAVPTSVGYGANFGGFAALLSMLNSCAANVAVVNIDAGFKGGYLAGLISRQSDGVRDSIN